jgi:integrase
MATQRLGRKTLAALPSVTAPTVIYDTDLKGFGLSVRPATARTPKGSRAWIVEFRPGAGGRGVAKKRLKIGCAETMTPERAREEARTILARVRIGEDPAAARAEKRAAQSITELAPAYQAETDPLRKPRTVELYKGLWANHLLPAVGASKVTVLTQADLAKLHRTIGKAHPSTANRVVILLAHFYEWAQRSGSVPKGFNPARGIEKFKEQGRERYLNADELARLGAALRKAETVGIERAFDLTKPTAKHVPKSDAGRLTKIDTRSAAAIRLLIFTGARLREILNLEWSHVDLARGLLFLPDSKSGKKTVVLGAPALEVLTRLHGSALAQARLVAPDARVPLSAYVFPSDDLSRPKADLKRPWALLIRAADLPGLRLHDLRHSFASVGVGSSMGLPIIGKLLGHANAKTTARYAHLDADPLRRASDLIGASIAAAMGGGR